MKVQVNSIEERITQLQKEHQLSSVGTNILKAQLFAGAKENKALSLAKEFDTPSIVSKPEVNVNKESVESTSAALQCGRCGGLMRIVTLSDNRRVKYCPRDSVVMPLPRNESFSNGNIEKF